jgi:hypothetical protein
MNSSEILKKIDDAQDAEIQKRLDRIYAAVSEAAETCEDTGLTDIMRSLLLLRVRVPRDVPAYREDLL